ncbi:hypothetical protein ACIOEX_18290, partial [Streptomyces sp. NPDC087850]
LPLPYGLSSPMAPHAGMDMDPAPMDAAEAMGGTADPAALAAALDLSAGMVAAHLVVAAVCALWLARGEAALFRLAHAALALAFAPLRLLLATARPPAAPRLIRAAPGARAAHRCHGVVLAHALLRRGPPALRVPRATAPGAAATTV